MRIAKREKLLKDSDVILAQIRAIDNSRFVEKLGAISDAEMEKIKELFDEIIE